MGAIQQRNTNSPFELPYPNTDRRLRTKNTLRGPQETTLFDYCHEHFKLHEFHIEFSRRPTSLHKRMRPSSLLDNGPWHLINFFCASRHPLSGFRLIRPIATTITPRILLRWEARREEAPNKPRTE